MDIDKIGKSFNTGLPSSKKVDGGNEFKQIFDRTLNQIDETATPALVDGQTEVIEQSDKILNLLDDYARGLTDPGKSLKDIEPLVTTIEKEVSLVVAAAADKGQGDQELEKLVQDLAVTANVAVLKFHRGDYL